MCLGLGFANSDPRGVPELVMMKMGKFKTLTSSKSGVFRGYQFLYCHLFWEVPVPVIYFSD